MAYSIRRFGKKNDEERKGKRNEGIDAMGGQLGIAAGKAGPVGKAPSASGRVGKVGR